MCIVLAHSATIHAHSTSSCSQHRHGMLHVSLPALAPPAAALRRAGGLSLRLRLRRRFRSEPRLRERDLRRRLEDGLIARMPSASCTV